MGRPADGAAPDGPDFVLGIDFGGTKVALATASGDGSVQRSARLATNAADGAEQVLRRTLECARGLVADTAATGGKCLAVGAVSPGIVEADRVLLAPNVPGWHGLSLPAALRDGLSTDRLALGNDVKAAALAESRWGSLRGADPALLVLLGTGVAAGIVVGGDVVAGAHGAAGEFGYNLRGPQDVVAGDGHAAPLEEAVGGRGIGERGARLLGAPVSAADVFRSSDVRARALVDEALDELAVHVANLAIALDPARVAVGGGLMAQAEPVLAALGRRLAAAVPFPPELATATFVHDGPLRGAIALALGTTSQAGGSKIMATHRGGTR
jgi:predicted NBD/HSP70 family sugar kinase